MPVRLSTRMRTAVVFILVLALGSLNALPSFADSAKSRVIVRELRSSHIAANKIGADPVRKMLIYLPAGYDESSSQRYPVIYFLPNPFEESYRFDFDHRDAQGLFDRAITDGVIKKFILVAVDMNTALGTSWYANSPVYRKYRALLRPRCPRLIWLDRKQISQHRPLLRRELLLETGRVQDRLPLVRRNSAQILERALHLGLAIGRHLVEGL